MSSLFTFPTLPLSCVTNEITKLQQATVLQMFEEPHFSTPPSSPPPGLHVTDLERQHNFKASSVSWCTDFLEVMGCEKTHNFKVSIFSTFVLFLWY